jgi:Chitin recognition protein
VSAGGPKLSCEFEGYEFKKRSLAIDAPPLVKRQMVSASASLRSRSSSNQSPTYTTSVPFYTPEPWGPGNTVILTTTVEYVLKVTYTTTIVLASMGMSSTSSPAVPTSSSNPSTDSRCGPDFAGKTCLGTPYGDCCSIYGWCGSASDNCGHSVCNPQYGTCDPAPPPGPLVSQDGVCGTNGRTCAGSTFGGCCSQYGYCGDASGFCGTGCQTAFGTCGGASGPPVSTDGTCSANSNPVGATCAASGFGDCCSEYGYCGATNAYCGTGCQSAFGTCP